MEAFQKIAHQIGSAALETVRVGSEPGWGQVFHPVTETAQVVDKYPRLGKDKGERRQEQGSLSIWR